MEKVGFHLLFVPEEILILLYLLGKIGVDPLCVVEVVALVTVEAVFEHDLEVHVEVSLALLFPPDNLDLFLLLEPIN